MISSVPYVPPDTIKKVAATRGQSVSFADFFLADEMTREGKLAGTDMLLNLYRRPPERISSPDSARMFCELAFEEYSVCFCMQQKNALWRIFFQTLDSWPVACEPTEFARRHPSGNSDRLCYTSPVYRAHFFAFGDSSDEFLPFGRR